jgi:hypothetical protein
MGLQLRMTAKTILFQSQWQLSEGKVRCELKTDR